MLVAAALAAAAVGREEFDGQARLARAGNEDPAERVEVGVREGRRHAPEDGVVAVVDLGEAAARAAHAAQLGSQIEVGRHGVLQQEATTQRPAVGVGRAGDGHPDGAEADALGGEVGAARRVELGAKVVDQLEVRPLGHAGGRRQVGGDGDAAARRLPVLEHE